MINVWKNLAEIGFFLSLLVNALLFIPQAHKLYKAKTAQGVSGITFLGFNVIQAFTGIHAYLAHDWLLLVGSILAFITCGTVTVLTYRYRHY